MTVERQRSVDSKNAIREDVLRFCQDSFPSGEHFACIYGSYATSHFQEESDLDIVFATSIYDQADFSRIEDFVISQHIKHGLEIDQEVPYDNKLLVTYQDIKDAARLDVFPKRDDGRYSVPEITDDPVFLASTDARKRLLLNAFTTPHIFIHGDRVSYDQLRGGCEKAVIKLARGIGSTALSNSDDILNTLLDNPEDGSGGRAYLGYKKERKEVVSHLQQLIARNWETSS